MVSKAWPRRTPRAGDAPAAVHRQGLRAQRAPEGGRPGHPAPRGHGGLFRHAGGGVKILSTDFAQKWTSLEPPLDARRGRAFETCRRPLATIWAGARILRLADGPDAVHWRKAGQMEFLRQRASPLAGLGYSTPARDGSVAPFRATDGPVSPEALAEVAGFESLMRE